MPRPHAPVIAWPQGEHAFWLNLGELRALEQACDAGFMLIWSRMISGQPRVDDIYQTIRLGLIGGGMLPDKAATLTAKAFEESSIMTLMRTAEPVLRISILWDEEKTPTGES
jgi:hypothetical protein